MEEEGLRQTLSIDYLPADLNVAVDGDVTEELVLNRDQSSSEGQRSNLDLEINDQV